LYLPESTGIAL